MKTLQDKIAVMQAAVDGKRIEIKSDGLQRWIEIPNCAFDDWGGADYRVKPEPREFWFVKNVGPNDNRYGWTRYDVRQEGIDFLEQIHVQVIE